MQRDFKTARQNLYKWRIKEAVIKIKQKIVSLSLYVLPVCQRAIESIAEVVKRALKFIVKDRVFTNDALHTLMT